MWWERSIRAICLVPAKNKSYVVGRDQRKQQSPKVPRLALNIMYTVIRFISDIGDNLDGLDRIKEAYCKSLGNTEEGNLVRIRKNRISMTVASHPIVEIHLKEISSFVQEYIELMNISVKYALRVSLDIAVEQ